MPHNSNNLSQAREITNSNLFDLARSAVRYHRRLVWACGLDPDDAAQAVAVSVLERQRGKHPYDPARATAQVYVRLVCSSICLNTLDKVKRRPARHPLPMLPMSSWTHLETILPDPPDPGEDILGFLGWKPPRVVVDEEVAWEAVQH